MADLWILKPANDDKIILKGSRVGVAIWNSYNLFKSVWGECIK
ncbi:MAG: hypothetical protein Q7U35_00535 [Methanobacteriaceae archaeon]|nr:hypothetical protein [Methanobacteriaceae archaeon]MDP2837506.1 hypothetical protein [Methanobacteriaceae archaeon]MDP3034742.1 hypothetical protein [Methanobacteriaceae archaeon]MDP3484116.1 hypothetical protein [Methanobacteriaceae archaeon]MDP3623963.1 hypothetical protein [Methanobacteriaceae archaeon]